MRSNESGATLIEVIVALTILLVVTTSALTYVAEIAHAVSVARDREVDVREAGRLLHAVVLWSREDLDRRLGNREQGSFRLLIDRPQPDLYTVVITDSLGTELLSTSVFRLEAL